MSDWNKRSKDNEPAQDGRYAVIYRQGSFVRRVVEDYSTREGWLTGMPDVEIVAWAPLPDIPQWVIEKYFQPEKQEA